MKVGSSVVYEMDHETSLRTRLQPPTVIVLSEQRALESTIGNRNSGYVVNGRVIA